MLIFLIIGVILIAIKINTPTVTGISDKIDPINGGKIANLNIFQN